MSSHYPRRSRGIALVGFSVCAGTHAGPISVRTCYDWMDRAEGDIIAGNTDSAYVAFAERVEAANLDAEQRA